MPHNERITSGYLDISFLQNLPNIDSEEAREMFRSRSTTVVAAFYDNGTKIIMAADRKTSIITQSGVGYNWKLDTAKIKQIGKFTTYGGAGVAEFIHRFGEVVQFAEKAYNEDWGYSVSSFGITGWIRILSEALSSRFGDISQFIVSGTNPYPTIFHIVGGMVDQYKTYCVIGSGTRTLRPLIAMNWRRDMHEEEMINLLLDAFMHTRREDQGSGWDEFNAPTIFLLNKTVRQIPEKEVFQRFRERQDLFIKKMQED